MEQASCCSHPILSHGDPLLIRRGPLGRGAHTAPLLECAATVLSAVTGRVIASLECEDKQISLSAELVPSTTYPPLLWEDPLVTPLL